MNYIVAAKDGLHCFYYKDGVVWFCQHDGNVWSQAYELISKVRANFTVNLVDDKRPFLIWQDDVGNLKKGRFGNGKVIDERTMIKSKDGLGQYRAIPADGGMNLVYSLPFAEGGIHMLMSQFVGENGAWGAVRRVDNIIGMVGGLFRLIPVAGKHFLAVYQNGGFESRIGYKEIFGDEIGGYNLLHSSIHSFGDCSFLATTHELHVACVVKGVFGSRLIYKKKGADGLSPGVVVAEGQGLHNIVLYVVNDKPHILFMRNDVLYNVGAEDDGYRWNFLPLDEREKSQNKQFSKAIFLTSGCNGQFLANELLVEVDKPWEIQEHSKYILAELKRSAQAQASESLENTEDDYNIFFDGMENDFGDFIG